MKAGELAATQGRILFHETTADLEGPAPYAMSAAEYLRRSKRDEALRVRAFLNGCFARYPGEHRPDLQGKLVSGDDRQHDAGVFELVMHEFLCRSGVGVEIHPKLRSGQSKRPDYRVNYGDGHQFVLELALGTEESDQKSRKSRLLATVYDAINAVHSPDFFLSLQTRGLPDAELNKRRPINELTAWIVGLNYNDVLELSIRNSKFLPRYQYTEKGLILRFVAMPKGVKTRGEPSVRTLGATGVGARWSRTQHVIKSRLREKATKYGSLEIPYVVALNVLTLAMDDSDVMGALFGPIKVPVGFSDDGPIAGEPYMEPGGVWLGKNGKPANRRLSGALIVRGLRAWNLGRVRWRLYRNPWASQPLPQRLLQVPEATLSSGQPQASGGSELWETLCLWEGWPVIGSEILP